MRKAKREIPIVGQKDQSFALAIEPPDGIKHVPFRGKEFRNRVAGGRILASASVSSRFVQGHVKLASRLKSLPIKGNFIRAWLDFCAESPDDCPINGHPAIKDDLLTGSARRHSRVSQELLQPNGHRRKDKTIYPRANPWPSREHPWIRRQVWFCASR